MKKTSIRLAILLAVVAGFVATINLTTLGTHASATSPAPSKERPSVVVACPGRIEGRSRTISVGAAIDGVVESIHVHDGQTVKRGDILAEIGCSDLKASLQVTKAEAESLEHSRDRLLHGSRQEERQAAAQKTVAARAVLEQATAHFNRYQQLWDSGLVSKAVYDEVKRDYEVAGAGLKQAMRNEELINAAPLEEDTARAAADIQAAQQRIELASDKLNKCTVRAPMNGTILHTYLRAGESFALLSPRPLFSLADVSSRRVRAEVDERDIGKVHVGQQVTVTSDAYPDQRFTGSVTELSSSMGRKSIVTGDPVDKSDRDILEVTAEMNGSAALPLGLRVTVQFLP